MIQTVKDHNLEDNMSLESDLYHHGIDLNEVPQYILDLVDEIYNEAYNKVLNSGVMMCNKLYPPENKWIEQVYVWCYHDIVNTIIKEMRNDTRTRK